MIRTFCIFMATFLPNVLLADVLAVRSGEHADFSRLVVQFPDAQDWTVTAFDGGYTLEAKLGAFEYDVDQVFKFIPKTRISRVENSAKNALKIFTRKGFHADAFELRKGRVVIDIKDGPPPPNSQFERPSNTAPEQVIASARTADAIAFGDPFGLKDAKPFFRSPVIDPFALNTIPQQPFTPSIADKESLELDLGAQMDQKTSPLQTLNVPNARVLKMEQVLIDQISRAATQGLLEADLPEKDKAVEARAHLETVQTSQPLPPLPVIPEAPKPKVSTHLRVQTAIDRDIAPAANASSEETAFDVCPPNDRFDITNWGTPLADGFMLGELRGDIFGEFDQPESESVGKLAKYYLYLSFGAEAKVALDDFGVFVTDAAELRQIANILDNNTGGPENHFGKYLDCPGSAGFWAALSHSSSLRSDPQTASYIAAYFSSLPIHLRQLLGPQVSEMLINAGDTKTAKLVQSALTRTSEDHGDSFELVDAKLRLADGDIDGALRALKEISAQDGPSAADALVRMIKIQAEQGKAIDKGVAETVEVLMVEHRGAPLEGSLTMASVLARTASGSPDLALDTLALPSTQSVISPKDRRALTSSAISAITETFDDLAFAKEAISLQAMGADTLLTDDVKIQVSTRLLALGFDDLALGFSSFEGDLDETSRMILAQIAARNGHHKKALAYLVGLETQDAVEMRADLYLKMDMPEMAAKEFKAAQQPDQANTANFIAENWADIAKADPNEFTNAAGVLTQDSDDFSSDEASLSTAQALLDHSASAREAFSALLTN